jgi:hypothetical protein
MMKELFFYKAIYYWQNKAIQAALQMVDEARPGADGIVFSRVYDGKSPYQEATDNVATIERSLELFRDLKMID